MGKECFKIVIFCVLQKCIIVQLKHFCTTLQEFLTMRRYRWEKYKMMSLFHRNVQQRFVGQILLSKGHELRIYVKIGLYQLFFLLWCLMMDLTTMTKCIHKYYGKLRYNWQNHEKFQYGSEMWSRISICIDLLRYIYCTFSKSRRIEFTSKAAIATVCCLA